MSENAEHREDVFAESAIEMSRMGLAVLPVGRDRTPLVQGFSKWSRAPAQGAVEKFAERHPDANIGIVPGLSNIFVVDADNADADTAAEELFGSTPLKVRTCRGHHLYYAKPCERTLPSNLRRYGFDIDLKHGNSIVIAPPSIHKSGIRYQLLDCDWSALRGLPRPKLDALVEMAYEPRGRNEAMPSNAVSEMRDGSRKQWLNDQLCREVACCDTFGELLDVAQTLNSNLADLGQTQLEDSIVVKRAQKVWQDAEAGKIKKWKGRVAVAKTRGFEIENLCQQDHKHAGDGLLLLTKLRLCHSARVRRGEAFPITPKAMARDQVIPGWTRERYENARDLLLQASLIRMIRPHRNTRRGQKSALYSLCDAPGTSREFLS